MHLPVSTRPEPQNTYPSDKTTDLSSHDECCEIGQDEKQEVLEVRRHLQSQHPLCFVDGNHALGDEIGFKVLA